MAKRHLLMLGLLLGCSGALATACSDAKIVGIEDGDAGAKGEAGAKGDAGSTGEGGDGGEAPFQFPDSLNPQDVIVVSPAPATSTHLLVGAKDYVAHSEIVSITLGTGAVGDATTYDDGDVAPVSSAGIGFALERTNDKVHLLDGGKISTTFDLKDLGTGKAPEGTKAYVPLYNQSLIVVLDLDEGKVSQRIDLNQFNAPGDSDHSADIAEGVYDASGKRVYFLLQRIDLLSYDGAKLPCSKNPGLIVGIDTETDEVLDLNGSAAGKAIELKLVNPRSLSINADASTLYLLADGCYEGTEKVKRGVEVVDLSADGETTISNEIEGNDYLASMILTGGSNALLESQDANYATHWNKLEIGGALGAELDSVPQGVSFDGKDLLGVQVTETTGAVVRYKLATEKSTVISPTSWAGQYSFGVGTALVQ